MYLHICVASLGWSMHSLIDSFQRAVDHSGLISQKVYIMSYFNSQLPHKSVNVFFILITIKHNLTDLLGNLVLAKRVDEYNL